MYTIEFTPNARRQLKKAPKEMAVRILAALKQLAEAPYQKKAGGERLLPPSRRRLAGHL